MRAGFVAQVLPSLPNDKQAYSMNYRAPTPAWN